MVKVKVKLSVTGLNRSLGFQEVEAPEFRQSAQEGGKVVSRAHRPSLPPGRFRKDVCIYKNILDRK